MSAATVNSIIACIQDDHSPYCKFPTFPHLSAAILTMLQSQHAINVNGYSSKLFLINKQQQNP